MDPWDFHLMDYNSRSGQHSHRHHNNHRRSRSSSFSSTLFAAICKSTEVEGGMMAYKKSRSPVETRNFKAEYNNVMRNSRIQRQWDDDPWLNDVKSMRARSAKTGVLNAEKYEAEAAFSKHGEFHLSFQSNMPSPALRSSDSARNTPSISCLYFSSDVESLYTHTSSIRSAKTEKNSHHVGREGRAHKWDIGEECSRDLHGKSLVREGAFRSTNKPFISADHHAKIKSKTQTRKDSKKLKQPNSPGTKLTNFLNLLFMSGGSKKPKLFSCSSVSDSNSYDSSEIKSASVYSYSSSVQSRPCLSKTSRRSNNSSGMSQDSLTYYSASVLVDEDSRSCGEKCLQKNEKYPASIPNPYNYPQITHPSTYAYKFYSASVLVDEDSRPCGEKCLQKKEKYPASIPNPYNYPQFTHPSTYAYKFPSLISNELKLHILEEDNHATAAAAAAAKDITGKYQKENSIMEAVVIRDLDNQEEEEEDDDDISCSSADLFELENWAEIDMSNVYQEKLPVCDTTHLDTNKAIGKRLIV